MSRTSNPLPRLRPGLEILRTGPREFVLVDPQTRHQFEFGAEERYLLDLVGKSESVDDVREGYEKRFQRSLSRSYLLEFFEQLRRHHLTVDAEKPPERPPAAPQLETPPPAPLSSADPNRRLNRVFDFLAVLFGWIFHPIWIIPVLAAAVVAFFILRYEGWRAFATFVGPTKRLAGLPLLSFVLLQTFLFVNIPRSILFGTMVRRFGGRVRAFGFNMWEGVIPTAYCEHHIDSWGLMTKRGQWTVLAFDFWYQLGYAAFALIGFAIARPHSFAAVFCVWLLPPCLLGLVLHLNVFIKYCGYYIVAYVTGEPELQSRALAETWAWYNFRRSPEALTHVQRYWFRVFGTSYWIFKLLLEGGLFIYLWWWLKNKYHAAGVVIWCAVLLWWYRESIYNYLQEKIPMNWLIRAGGSAWFRWSIRLLLVFGFVAVGLVPYNYEVVGECRVVPESVFGVRAHLPDEIVQVNVAEGDYVEPGTVIAKLSGRQVRMEYLTTEAELRKSEAALDKLMTGYLDEDVQIAKDRVQQAVAKLKLADIELARVRKMVREKSATAEELDHKIKAQELAQEAIITARENLSRVQQGFRDEMLREAEADVKRDEEKLKFYDNQLKLTELKSPIAGRVIFPYMKPRKGQHVNQGELVTVVQDTKDLMVEVASDDAAALDVREGMPVHVRLYGNYGELLTGKVQRVAVTGETNDHFGNPQFRTDLETYQERGLNSRSKNGNYDVRVYVKLDKLPPDLTTEMYGYARVVVDEDDVFWRAMARPLVRFLRTEVWSWLP